MGSLPRTGIARLDEVEIKVVMGFRELSPGWQQMILATIAKALADTQPPPDNIIPFRPRIQ